MTTNYTKTEEWLLAEISNMREIPAHQLEEIANSLDKGNDIWIAIELGRCPSTDQRTYILHEYWSKPGIDYYGAERYNIKDMK